MMTIIDRNGLRCLQFPSLAGIPGVSHGIFVRSATDADGSRVSLNAGLKCGDPDERVWDNRNRMRAALGLSEMVFARQVHGCDAAVFRRNGEIRKSNGRHTYLEGDALVTAETDCALFIQAADCQPVMLVDPVRRVLANIHSGWRGSILNVIGRTIQLMGERFGCRARDMAGAVGPSLGPCCAEFVNYRQEIPERYWPYGRSDRHFDFWRLSLDQMTAAGLRKENIALAGICTRCNQHLLFSYRGDHRTGRFAAVIGWSPKAAEA